ncbi:protein kinase domain-containing protein [Archangium primigenium]|uniref:protein kinase domain-containing protein n=1 Tax=[Archangium] primigenium TaxID=2792470 RepID=UPI00195DE439|nr:serine/threonine protein kinase [Archangium primigenium]
MAKLAAGGMAITYRARMRGAAGVTKPVVIKQILPHFADEPAFVEMFISEARVAAALTHGNIAQVFDFGEIGGQYFLAMEFVHGQPLSKLLRRAQRMGLPGLPVPLALYIASQICDGLDYAHRHRGEDGEPLGLVHRDVSPDNVLISYEGQVKVIDFGIAKATSFVEARTSPGTLKGKYPYFSTEQARGEQDLDARSDTFAVGVVLYEMLCGRRPYEGEFAAVLPRLLAGDYPAPSALNPSITPELEAVLGTAMALDRDERYPTAQAFSEALREQLYSSWPRFSPHLVAQLLGHLFAEDLAVEGHRVEVTPAFLAQFSEWKSSGGMPGLGPSPVPGSEGGRAGSGSGSRGGTPRTPGGGVRPRSNTQGGMRAVSPSSPGRRSVSSTGVPRVSSNSRPEVPRPHDTPVETPALPAPSELRESLRQTETRVAEVEADKRNQWLVLLSVPLVALGVLGIVVHRVSASRSGAADTAHVSTQWIRSEPSGATVKLDGRELPDLTPLMVADLALKRTYTLEFSKPGYQTATRRIIPRSTTGAEPELSVRLVPASGALAAAPPAAAPPEAAPPTPEPEPLTELAPLTRPALAPTLHAVDYPARMFVLRPQYNAFPLSQYATASIELNPTLSYTVSTDGGVALARGTGGTSDALAYYLEGDQVTADESFGVLGAGKRTFKGIRRMHVFAVDDDLSDNSGAVRVKFQQGQWLAPRVLTFTAAENALVLKPEHQFVLRGLNPEAVYLLTVRDDAAQLGEGANGRIHHALCMEGSQQSARRTPRLLESGKRIQLSGVDTLRCTFPDTRLEDNQGAFEVDIVDVTEMSKQERAAALRGETR